jgi:putative aldouronate transport system permease protein
MRIGSHLRWYRLQANLAHMVVVVLLVLLSLACLLPFALVLSASLSNSRALTAEGYSLLPRDFSFAAYTYVFTNAGQVLNAYRITLLVTVIGTLTSLLVTALLAYAISRRRFSLRQPIAFFLFFTILFNGGLVPWYLLITQGLNLKNNFLVLILPYLVGPFNVLVLRTYFSALPEDLLDAARVDGAGEWRVFFQIVVPLSTPALATIGLFIMLQYWNDWWLGLVFITRPDLQPIQLLLYNILTNVDFLQSHAQTAGVAVPVTPVRMAMAVLTTAPVAIAFLLVQKYFVRGITIGGLKG